MRGFCAGLRILLVTQMWPTEAEPDLGAFLLPAVRAFREAGHEVEVSALSQRGGSAAKYARLCSAAVRAARRFRPDVVFAHFLFPAGFAGLLAARAAAYSVSFNRRERETARGQIATPTDTKTTEATR